MQTFNMALRVFPYVLYPVLRCPAEDRAAALTTIVIGPLALRSGCHS